MIKKFLPFIFLFILFSCTNNLEKNKGIKEIMNNKIHLSKVDWDKLAQKKIYFGHQSVGYNIMDGVKDLATEENSVLNIVEGSDLSAFNKPVFAHDRNGINKDPKSKIDGFYEKMKNGVGDTIDIASFKFCYIDFTAQTNVAEVFEYYKLKMSELELAYPNVEIIHFTVPLRTIQKGPKAFIKKLIGKSIGIEDNYARKRFNELLLKEFAGKPLFDLAKLESTYPNGDREYVLKDNEKIYALVPDYTEDGGHLVTQGKIIIAENLLLFLAQLSNE